MVFVAAILLLAGAAVSLGLALNGTFRDRAIRDRLRLIGVGEEVAAGAASDWRVRLLKALRTFYTFGARHRWPSSIPTPYLLACGFGSSLACWLVCEALLGFERRSSVILAAVTLVLSPRLVTYLEQRRISSRFGELLPDAIDMVVRIVRAGLPVAVAIRTVADETSPPLSDVFRAAANQIDIGVAVEEALARTSQQIGNPDFHFFAVAVTLQQSTGGNLAATLETLSQIIRKRRAVRMKAYAATAEVRLSAVVLGAIPFFVTGALLIVAPTYLDPLFNDPRGHLILGAAIFGLVLAGLTMRGMIRHALSA